MNKSLNDTKIPGRWIVFLSLGILLGVLLGTSRLNSQTTTTNTTLTKPEHIETFLHVTQKLRCICLPSLPIQGCTYNICAVSSYLKTFIENRIREGMSGEEIIQKFETGFGESILDEPKDPVILHFEKQGNRGMILSLVNGFGKNIQAEPDSTWINLSLGLIGLGALIGIGYYLVQRKKVKQNNENTLDSNGSNKSTMDDLEKKYLSEI